MQRSNRLGGLLVLAILVVAVTALAGTRWSGHQAQAQDFLRPGPTAQAVLLAQYDEEIGDAALLRFIDGDLNYEVLREYDNLPLVSIALLADIDAILAIRQLLDFEGVVNVTEDVPLPTLLDTSVPWIGASAAHALGYDGAGTTIAVMDTGIGTNHPFVAGRVVEEACFSNPTQPDRESLCPDGTDTQVGAGSASSEIPRCFDGADHICSHGPHVTGIAAGDGTNSSLGPDSGVAPGAEIVAYQVFYRVNDAATCDKDWPPENPDDPDAPDEPDPDEAPCLRSLATDRIAAIDHLLDLIDDGRDVVALNVSIGGGEYEDACSQQAEEVAYAALRDAGVIPVVAAGNDGFGQAVGTPACTPSAMTVGNTRTNDHINSRSNRGSLLDVFAPGTSILSNVGGSAFGNKTGTSMSAPHVAGALAVLAEAHPTLPTSALEAALVDSGVPITYTSGPGTFLSNSAGWTAEVTTPRIDLRRALTQLEGAGPLAITADIAEVVVDEGELATTSGTVTGGLAPVELTASYGTIEVNGQSWQWQQRTVDGPPEGREVTLTATDALGVTEAVSFELVVDNVAPTVVFGDSSWDRPLPGNPTPLDVTFIDPGIFDFDSGPFTIEVDCDADRVGTGVAAEDVGLGGTEVLQTFTTPLVEGRVAGVCRTDLTDLEPPFTVQVTVTDKDGDSGTAAHPVRWFDLREGQIRRIEVESPVARWLEARTIIEQAEKELLLDLDIFGPPDIDLDLEWRWGDDTTLAVEHPLGRDEDLAPQDVRDLFRGVRSTATHTWRLPGLYQAELEVRGGDEPLPANDLTIAVTGTRTAPRDLDGWSSWANDDPLAGASSTVGGDGWQVRLAAAAEPGAAEPSTAEGAAAELAAAEHRAYLELVAHLSPATGDHLTLDEVVAALDADAAPDSLAALRAELMAAWLNVVSGAVHLDAEVTADGHTGSVESLLLDAEGLLTRSAPSPVTLGAVTATLAGLNTDGARRVDDGDPQPPADTDADDGEGAAEQPPAFIDVDPDNVHAAAIAWLVEAGITQGFDDGTFRPGTSVTRQQMASFLTRALGYAVPVEVERFGDVSATNVHRGPIAALAEEGVTEGCAPGRFCPGDPVLRGQMASFLTRALDYLTPEQPRVFLDVQPTDVHRDAISALADAGVTEGCSPTRFCPADPVTRGQMASFLQRALAEAEGVADAEMD